MIIGPQILDTLKGHFPFVRTGWREGSGRSVLTNGKHPLFGFIKKNEERKYTPRKKVMTYCGPVML